MWPQGICFCFYYFKNICFVSLSQRYQFLWHTQFVTVSPLVYRMKCSGWVARPHASREAAESDKRYWQDKIMMQYREHWSCLFEFELTRGAAVTLSVPELYLSVRHGGSGVLIVTLRLRGTWHDIVMSCAVWLHIRCAVFLLISPYTVILTEVLVVFLSRSRQIFRLYLTLGQGSSLCCLGI